MDYIKNQCGAVYLSIFFLILNLVFFIFIYRGIDSMFRGTDSYEKNPINDDNYNSARKKLVMLYIILPILSIVSAYFACKHDYIKVAYIPAVLFNTPFIMSSIFVFILIKIDGKHE
jgi:hypothetical protein